MIELNTLPTHLAIVGRRLHVVGAHASADTWLMSSYVCEALVKTIGVVLVSAIRRGSTSVAHNLSYEIVRADGLGTWEKVIGDCTSSGYAGYLHSDVQSLVSWVTKKRTQADDQWARTTASLFAKILDLLGLPDTSVPPRLTARFILSQCVRIRNKTKAHGAVGPDFFEQANPLFTEAVSILTANCPVTSWEWYHLAVRSKNESVRGIHLIGPSTHHLHADASDGLRPSAPGIHFRTHSLGDLFFCGELLTCNWECSDFYFPNGGYTNNGTAEFLDYGSGRSERVELTQYLQPPAPLPKSATEGTSALDVFSNIFGNLPSPPDGYVKRPHLETELLTRLRDRNHPIITLHGRGGMGKTSLALQIAHDLSRIGADPFDQIIWLSARDLELKPSGATEVRRAIADLPSVCRAIAQLLNIPATTESFALLLQDPACVKSTGTLFVFDNFETLDDPREMHRFLGTHVHLPNKVLVTSRERDPTFKGDYPIEVGGMEFDEARQLLIQEAAQLGIEPIVDDDTIAEIFQYTDGHAYVMRVLLGEMAKERRLLPLKSLVPKRADLLNVVFERSFNKLTTEGRWVFLAVANWRSAVADLVLMVVLGLRELNAEGGLDECVRLSLLNRVELSDGSFCYSAPELARAFAKKKLEGDPDRLLIAEDIERIREFGALQTTDVYRTDTSRIVQRFIERTVARLAELKPEKRTELNAVMSSIAELWPSAWLSVARFRQAVDADPTDIDYAFRRAVEEAPYSKEAWIARAQFAESRRDDATRIAALVSAVDADPADVQLIREVAFQLCAYVDAHKWDIPTTRRGVYLASVRDHMARVAGQLDATGLSRLAWLFLLENNEHEAWKYANMGLAKDSVNPHCLKIVQKMEADGYVPRSLS